MTEAAAVRAVLRAVEHVREPVEIVDDPATGELTARLAADVPPGAAVHARLPASYPEWLGDPSFARDHGTRFAYAAGAMANGIASPALVAALAEHGMLGFFGAAGLALPAVLDGLDELARRLPTAAWGANLIHAPHEPALEWETARAFVARGVRCVEASAYLALTPAVVYVACKGLARDAAGAIRRPRAVFGKVSRPEVARLFLSPAPPELVGELVRRGALTDDEAQLAGRVALATDLTVEADSGGHTDNRPLAALVPMMRALRDELARDHALASAPRVGAAGGLGTPAAVAAALALGADYVVTGSVNQAAIESGLSDAGRRMLAEADVADVAMAAAADMFELGVKLQVLRRGTMFAARANRLYELYRDHAGLDALPAAARGELEDKVFRASLDDVWRETQAFWQARDPDQLARADADPKHRMALVFRWYLGKSSRWAIAGEPSRRGDYQIWCGPAMGAFNRWVRGSALEDPAARTVGQIGLNLLEGAAVIGRATALRACGVALPAAAFEFRPRRLGLG